MLAAVWPEVSSSFETLVGCETHNRPFFACAAPTSGSAKVEGEKSNMDCREIM